MSDYDSVASDMMDDYIQVYSNGEDLPGIILLYANS